MRGGRREGAGRPQGSPNKVGAARVAELAASGEMPLDYLIRVMRNPKETADRRFDAAKAAAPYCHPRLTSVAESSTSPNETMSLMPSPELVAPIIARFERIAAGLPVPDLPRRLNGSGSKAGPKCDGS